MPYIRDFPFFQIPDGLTGSGTGYSLRIMGLNATTVYMPLELLTKTSSVFVQTDKATYKPGDTGKQYI